MFYKTCPDCGANLDYSEVCDCKKEEAAPLPRKQPLAKNSTVSLSASLPNVKKTGRGEID